MRSRLLALSFAALLSIGATAVVARTQENQQQPSQDQQESAPRSGRRFDPQQRVDMLARQLKLTDDQKQKLLPILTDQQQQMQTLRQDSSMSRDDKMAKMKSMREDSNSKISAILNDDQKQKFAKMQDRMSQRMGQGRGESSSPPQQ